MPAGNIFSTTFDSRDLIADFDLGALQATNEDLWSSRISIEVPSNREVEEMAWLGQVPVMRRWIGGRKEVTLNKYTLTVRNYPYEATVPFSIDDLRRDKIGIIRKRISDLGARTVTHWNKLVGDWVTAGEAGSLALAYDGNFLYDTDHSESGTNQSNDLTATEVPSANVATTSTLTTTEAANIITETIAYMMSLTDDQGEPINQSPTEVLILCTKVGHYTGLKTALGLNNLGTGAGNNNPLLAWNDYRINVQYVPTSRITAADKLYFFFGNPSTGGTPLIRTVEQDVAIRFEDETFRNRRQVFGVDAVRGMAYGAWQRTALVTLS
jgi:phage major head subunit gpT-like protein